VFDADVMGPGTHKVIIGRRQVGLFGDQAVVTQLVFDVKVAAFAAAAAAAASPSAAAGARVAIVGLGDVEREL
jgi:hypothetical protein